MSWIDWTLRALLKHFAIDEQQGSLAITNAATRLEWGAAGGKYANRIWEAVPMPHTKHPECRRQVWEFVSEELKLGERGLLNELGA